MKDNPEMPLKILRANADYTVVDHSPLRFSAGDTVRLGDEDKGWTGWIWVTNAEGRGTYLPVILLERTDGPEAIVTEGFAAVDLSLRKGARVRVLREISGWFWCQDDAGTEGWVPDYVLSPAGGEA